MTLYPHPQLVADLTRPVPTRDPAAASGEAAAAGGALLDQKRENRTGWDPDYTPEEGEGLLLPVRSGGGYDPLGARSCDIQTADQIATIAKTVGGRWAFVTLTLDRTGWTNPFAAYIVASERVRKTLAPVAKQSVYLSVLEWQTKTGDGWAHWHALVWIRDGVTIEEFSRRVAKSWSIFEPVKVDHETGEVRKYARVSLGFVKCDQADCNVAVAKYIAKYVVKEDEAGPPPWLLLHSAQLRKYRKSKGWNELAERLHLHVCKRGPRRVPQHRRRPARTLLERIATSGLSTRCLVYRAGRWATVGFLAMPTRLVPKRDEVRPISRSRGEFSEVYRLPPGSLEYIRAEVARNREEIRRRVEFFRLDRTYRALERWRKVQEDRLWASAVEAVTLPRA